MNQDQARILREAHDGYVRSIARMPKATLANMYRNELAALGSMSLYGGPASKDELVAALVELRYPLAKLNESVHVLYHVNGITNEVCEQCNPKPACGVCGSTGTCRYERGDNSPVINGRHADA